MIYLIFLFIYLSIYFFYSCIEFAGFQEVWADGPGVFLRQGRGRQGDVGHDQYLINGFKGEGAKEV